MVDLLAHAVAAPLFADSIVIFGRSGQNGLDEFLRGLVADRLGYGMEGRAVAQKNFTNGKMIFGVPCKPIHAEDNEGMDFSFPLPAEFQGRQEFFPVVQAQILRRFTFFPEELDDFNIPLLAIFAAEVFLELERGAFHLLVA